MNIEKLEDDRIDAVVRLSIEAWAPVFLSIEDAMEPELFRRSYPGGLESSQRQAVADVCGSDEMEVWTAVEGDETLGFVAVHFDHGSKVGEVHMVAVDPKHQKRGVASALTQFALDRMKKEGMDVAMVETGADPGHEAARRTYERAGFSPWPAVKFFKYLTD